MKFTIVTVCLNAASTVSGVIRSVRDQTYRNVEHLVLDGGSTDGTVERISRLSHSRLLLTSEPDNGIYDAMNKGIRRATGDILVFLNADDEFAGPDVLLSVSNVFKAQPQLKLAYGDVEGLSQDGIKLLQQPRNPNRSVLARTTICHQALFTHRELFHEIGEYRTDLPIVADWDWLYRAIISRNTPVQCVPIVVSRIGMEGLSHRTDFWNEKREALQQYYTDNEIWRYRIFPLWLRQKRRRLTGIARRSSIALHARATTLLAKLKSCTVALRRWD